VFAMSIWYLAYIKMWSSWCWSSVVKLFLSMLETLGSIPSREKKNHRPVQKTVYENILTYASIYYHLKY
jgi:hypothetical protein